jgi:hypothetical protein
MPAIKRAARPRRGQYDRHAHDARNLYAARQILRERDTQPPGLVRWAQLFAARYEREHSEAQR